MGVLIDVMLECTLFEADSLRHTQHCQGRLVYQVVGSFYELARLERLTSSSGDLVTKEFVKRVSVTS